MFFKDWRLLDQSPVGLPFEKEYIYYVHSRAWALKGWLGGTHSWITFWSNQHDKWLVVELTDKETITIQHANLLYVWDNVGYRAHCPIVSDRTPDAKWFGTIPKIHKRVLNTVKYSDIEQACRDYPFKEFDLLTRNCNTFSSYIIDKLNLNIEPPLRSFGFRGNKFWKKKIK